MFYRFVQNIRSNKAVIAPDFRLELATADCMDLDLWAPFNAFGYFIRSTSTKADFHAGELLHDSVGFQPETFTLIPACTETKVVDNGRIEILSLFLRPLFCCGIPYNFPTEPVLNLRNPGIDLICRGLADDINRREVKNMAPIEAKVSALISALSIITVPKDPVRTGLDPATLARIVRVIETRIADRLTNDMLAEIAGLTVDTFRRKFQESTGIPTHQYIARARAARARQLIEEGKLPLAEVALEAGYSSQSHMTRMFVETFGVSPGRFKRMRSA